MDEQTIERVDTAIEIGGLLLRAGAYALIGGIASHYSCGQAILTGLFFGDVAASAVGVLLAGRDHCLQRVSELLLLGMIYLLLGGSLVWPADSATRAIVMLAALGVFAGRAGGGVLTRFGPSDDGFA